MKKEEAITPIVMASSFFGLFSGNQAKNGGA
jgi:hypothetical protein